MQADELGGRPAGIPQVSEDSQRDDQHRALLQALHCGCPEAAVSVVSLRTISSVQLIWLQSI
jgi:hypothetical protein